MLLVYGVPYSSYKFIESIWKYSLKTLIQIAAAKIFQKFDQRNK